MLLKLAWRNLWRNKLRTSIMLCAIVVGLGGVALLMGFMTGMTDNMVSNAIRWQTSHIQIHNPIYHQDPDISNAIANDGTISALLDEDPNVVAWTSRHIVNGMIASARANRGLRINGVDIDKETEITPILEKIIDGEWLAEVGRNPILVSQKTATRLKLRIGSKVVLTFSDINGDVTGAAFRVQGIFKTPSSGFDDSNVFVRKSDLKALTKVNDDHEIALLLSSFELATAHSMLLSQQINLDPNAPLFLVEDWQSLQPLLKTMISSMSAFNWVMLIVFVSAMGFGIVNIMLMSVFERTQEFGVLMAVGMEPSKVRKLIILESACLGLCGAILGVAVGAVGIGILQLTGIDLSMAADGLAELGMDTVLYPRVELLEFLSIFVMVITVSVLSALYPARQIIKQNPIQAMAEKH